MQDKIRNIIPAIYAEIASDGENESRQLLRYYTHCNREEKAVVNNIMIYLCGWGFDTILEKCGISITRTVLALDRRKK
jgi:hypothetical protein